MFFIICFLLIVFTISYLLLRFIYRKVFKSQEKISKFLVFVGGICLVIFYYNPYSYYLEPSFWKFKQICKLDPEIYQYNGGKIDKEYANKVLAYYDLDWDTMVKTKERIQLESYKTGKIIPNNFMYELGSKYYDRIKISLRFFVITNEKNEVIEITGAYLYADWDNLRPYLDANGGEGFHLLADGLSCFMALSKADFKKFQEWEKNNEKQ